jgi:ABC-type uncharacterized transport system permease subunit
MSKKSESIIEYSVDIIIALIAVFVFTTAIVFFSGSPPFLTYYHIFIGSLGSLAKFSHVIKVWIPLTLCACGLLYTFRIGLWNIGIEGQVMMGAVFTTAVLRFGLESNVPVLFYWMSFVAGIIGGAFWALIAGVLKTKGGVNEIFAGLGLNFVAQGIILWLIFGPWKIPGTASMSGTEPFPQEMWMSLWSWIRIYPAGLIFALAALILTTGLLLHSRIGLRLKATGNNLMAAKLFGVAPGKYMLFAMIFAGSFGGLAGSIQVTGVYHRLIPAISSNYGYLALLVVMLANYNLWIAAVVAFCFACLNVGSIQLPMVLKIDSSLCGVIQGALVLAALAVYSWRSGKKRRMEQSQDV